MKAKTDLIYYSSESVVQKPFVHDMFLFVVREAVRSGMNVQIRVADPFEKVKGFLDGRLSDTTSGCVSIEDGQLGRRIPKNGMLFTHSALDLLYAALRWPTSVFRRPRLFWLQGLLSDESFMRNQSNVRRRVLRAIEATAVRCSTITIIPSEAMEHVLRSRYQLVRGSRFYILPNLVSEKSTLMNRPWELWGYSDRPSLTLGYMGSLAKWQCFDETCSLVSRLQMTKSEAQFLVLCNDPEGAEAIIRRHRIRQYKVKSVASDVVDRYMEAFDLGFMLRREHVVNKVSCPLKWLQYWRNGTPIITTPYVDIVKDAKGSDANFFVDLADLNDASCRIQHHISAYLERKGRVKESLRQTVREHFTWESHALPFRSLLSEVSGFCG
ncbi:MAG: hypothetical protein KJ000_35695 [Pirellulaceae bacterium]|nr:hypothetical protein [Pirellulaceae bacterium]